MPEQRTIDADDDGIRVDRWFKRHYPHLNHILLEKLLRKGEVRLDGKRAKAADRIAAGQVMRLPPQVMHAKLPEKAKAPEPHPLAGTDTAKNHMGSLADRILYMDKQVIVIDKPSGLATQGGSGD
jgi:23S rRNA pseudouridine955/2504/2580 synthase